MPNKSNFIVTDQFDVHKTKKYFKDNKKQIYSGQFLGRAFGHVTEMTFRQPLFFTFNLHCKQDAALLKKDCDL